MILLFHLYQNNTEKATFEIQKFHTDLSNVCFILEGLVDVAGRRSHLRRGRLHYKDVTPLLEACILGDVELVDWLLTRFGASLEVTCARKNRFEQRGLNSIQDKINNPGIPRVLIWPGSMRCLWRQRMATRISAVCSYKSSRWVKTFKCAELSKWISYAVFIEVCARYSSGQWIHAPFHRSSVWTRRHCQCSCGPGSWPSQVRRQFGISHLDLQ